MFWGLTMKPHKEYSQTVEKSFHVSMASLHRSTADDGLVEVIVDYDDHSYLLCSLQKGHTWQVPLDLNFKKGSEITFTSNGCGRVYLTGYYVSQNNLDETELGSEEEEDEEEIPQLRCCQRKRKAQKPLKNAKNAKRSKAVVEQEESVDDSDDEEEEELQQLSKKEKQKLANSKDAKQEQTSQQQEKARPEQAQQQQQQEEKNKAEQQHCCGYSRYSPSRRRER